MSAPRHQVWHSVQHVSGDRVTSSGVTCGAFGAASVFVSGAHDGSVCVWSVDCESNAISLAFVWQACNCNLVTAASKPMECCGLLAVLVGVVEFARFGAQGTERGHQPITESGICCIGRCTLEALGSATEWQWYVDHHNSAQAVHRIIDIGQS
jgi:hypothetical protein